MMLLKRTVVHVGLQKTGTTSLQRQYFPLVSERLGCLFNPDVVVNACDAACQKKFIDVDDEIKRIADFSSDCKYILSWESLAGDGWYSFEDHHRAIDFVSRAFGSDVDIILVLRNQADIVESLFRHAIKKRDSITFDRFINYDCGKFARIVPFENGAGPINVNVRIDYPSIIRNLKGKFLAVNVFYYEMLLKDADQFYALLSKCLGYDQEYKVNFSGRNNVSINYVDVKIVQFFGRIFMWNGFNYPWREGNYFGRMTRVLFNKLAPYIFKLVNFFIFNRGMKYKKFVNKYRSEIIAENAWNCELDVPLDYESYYSASDKETNTLGK